MRELGMKEANLQAPPTPPCLCWQKFMPPAQSIYACRVIREIPWEKAVAYARALQHWAEKIDLPAGGRPCQLAKSVKELREEVKCYLSFSDEEVFKPGSGPSWEGGWSESRDPTHWCPQNTLCTTASHGEERSKVLGVGKIPTSLLTSGGCWGDLPTIQGLKAKRRTNSAPLGWTSKASSPSIRDFHPIQTLLTSTGISSCPTTNSPPCSFTGVTACPQIPQPSEMASEAPHDTLSMGVVVTPRNSTISTSCIIRDEVTGVTYMDMVTISIGRVAISGPDPEASSQGPTIEDVTDHE